MSTLEKNAVDPYRQPPPRTPARRIADDAEVIRAARELAELFAEEASLCDRQRRLPVAELEVFSQSGLWGISVPRTYGGAEVGYRTLAEVLKTIAAVDLSLVQLSQNHLAVLDHLRLDDSEEQKRSLYDLVLDGVRFGNIFSECHSRTVAGFQTRVLVDGNGFRIDGRKFYSSGALLAHQVPAAGLDAEQCAHLVFVPRDAPGLTAIDDRFGLGQRTTASGTVIPDNVRASVEHTIPVRRAFDRPTAAGAVPQFIQTATDADITHGILAGTIQQVRRRARPWIDVSQQRAREDPYTIQQAGDLRIHVRVAETALDLVADAIEATLAAPNGESVAAASMAVAEAKVLTTEAALFAANRLFELTGTRLTLEGLDPDCYWRNARTHTLHDPMRWKYYVIGNYQLNGVKPPRHAWLQEPSRALGVDSATGVIRRLPRSGW